MATIGQDYDPPTHIVPRVLKRRSARLIILKFLARIILQRWHLHTRLYSCFDLADAHILTLKHLLQKPQ